MFSESAARLFVFLSFSVRANIFFFIVLGGGVVLVCLIKV